MGFSGAKSGRGTPDLDVAATSLKEEFEPLRFILSRKFDGLIVDAGGYIGTAAIALHRLFPDAQVVTIEPSEDNFSVLTKNVRNFPNIHPIHGALVGSKVDKVRVMDPGEKEWGFTTTPTHKGSQKGNFLGHVTAFRLNDFVEKYGHIGIVKLDIEGGELDIFENAGSALHQSTAVFVELHERFVPGCTDAFWKFAKDRIVVKDSGEKFLAVRR